MHSKKWIARTICLLATAAGLFLTLLTRSAAIADGASTAAKLPFALSLLLLIVGVVLLFATLRTPASSTDVRKLTMSAMFAALCYIGFAYLRIDIPVGSEKTAFHLGNVFCVLAALFLGGLWGGMSGAVGLTLADLTSGYITSAPKTFFMKLGIALVTGLVAHKLFRITGKKGERRGSLPVAAALSSAAGMAFNVIADPIVGYFYKTYVLGVPQDAAKIWVKLGAVTTLVNAVIAVVVSTVLYLALRPALDRTHLSPT